MAKVFLIESGILAWHCPGCAGGHQVPVEGERKWGWNGSLESPTITPSVLVHGHKGTPPHFPDQPTCHSIITDGNIAFCGDSQHSLAGKTVDIPDWDE